MQLTLMERIGLKNKQRGERLSWLECICLTKQVFSLVLERHLRAVWDTSLGIEHEAIIGRDPEVFHSK